MFTSTDSNADGFVESSDAVALFHQSGLERQALFEVWQIADVDEDGRLSLSEFVAGLKESGSSAMQLHEPDNSVSSRRYFRGLNFHHPLHNVAHLSTLHQFGDM